MNPQRLHHDPEVAAFLRRIHAEAGLDPLAWAQTPRAIRIARRTRRRALLRRIREDRRPTGGRWYGRETEDNMTDTNTPSPFWRACMKRPVVVHVRDATPGEEVFTREATPDGWDPTSGGAYVRELWVDSAAAALEVNAALAGAASPRVERALATWTVCLWLCSAPVDEPRLLGMRMAAGEMEIDVEHVGARLLAASFRESLERLGAENYIELRLTSRTDPPLPMLVTIQRLDGKTPHDLRREAEEQRDALLRELAQARGALATINGIRNSIIGSQSINWSEHIYPLVAALDCAGFFGESYPEARANVGTLIERVHDLEAQHAALRKVLASAADGRRPILTPEEVAGSLDDSVEIVLSQRAEYRDDAIRLLAELGQARERIAALDGQVDGLARLAVDTGVALSTALEERDAALARVAELEAERDGLQRQRDVEWERAKVARARVYELEADEARIRADERERIAAAIERDHQPGTYPHEMAKAIRANATPGGRSLSEDT